MHATELSKGWIKPALPEDEVERLAALNRFALLDTSAEEAFDSITRLAAAPHAFTDQMVQLVQLLTGTLGATMRRQHAEKAILEIARTASIESGRDLFNCLVIELAGMVDAQYVFIGELSAADRQSMRLVAVHGSAENREGHEFPLEGLLAQPDKVESTLQVFAARAAAELVRQRAERNLREQTGVLQSCVTVAEGCNVVANFGPQLFTEYAGAFYLANPARKSFEQGAVWGGVQHSEEIFTQDDCWALRRSQLHCVDNQSSGLVCKHVKAEAGRLAYQCAPLMAQGETVGLLFLEHVDHSSNDAHLILDSARRLAVMLAEQLALANIQLRETLRNQSIRDALTGLYNRRFFEESIKHEFSRSQRSAMPKGNRK